MSRVFVRDAAGNPLSGTFDIRRCKLGDADKIISPDIELTQTGDEIPSKAVVTYSKVEVAQVPEESTKREFATLAAAEANMNTEKSNNTISGTVTIDVTFDAEPPPSPAAPSSSDANARIADKKCLSVLTKVYQ